MIYRVEMVKGYWDTGQIYDMSNQLSKIIKKGRENV